MEEIQFQVKGQYSHHMYAVGSDIKKQSRLFEIQHHFLGLKDREAKGGWQAGWGEMH